MSQNENISITVTGDDLEALQRGLEKSTDAVKAVRGDQKAGEALTRLRKLQRRVDAEVRGWRW